MAPVSAKERPSQYKQSSRKGKKAWRKNIDLTDIEKSIETKIEQEISHGVSDISTLQDTALFQVDIEGDNVLKNKLIKRKQIKKNLKSKEILDSIKTTSKIGAVTHRNHHLTEDEKLAKKKVQGVSKKELNKLLALAGRVQGEYKLKARLAKDGLVKSQSFVFMGFKKILKVQLPSGIKLDASVKEKIPEELLTMSTTSWSVASVKPETLKKAPLQLREFQELPHAGKSYNPDKKEWSSLIDKEYQVEKIKEENRIALEEYRERIKHLIETLDDNEEEESSNDEKEEEFDEDEDNTSDVVKLSINTPVQNKKKTKYQRNKAKRHEEKMKLQQELKKLKQQVHELEKLENIEEEVLLKFIEDKNKKQTTAGGKIKKTKKFGTKYGLLDERLEVKFSDELSDSLRKLKPEGNLLYDNVRKLQSSGKIESRVPVKRGRRYKQKITEKWTHKDFK
ncbi:Nop53p NDAI_0E02340 [Naumovozyma dairenensis CBS 421]|uniref:Ribosome biogenesis protein NOP53 n=1 Tax=Naumovozyma dairenensis (strain ATCC 10597 / BCRC 20456 / CBS 421 / NBRC 0211 / NRRL Y-12639) TaxID=1071378 RepID=G0WBD1_NAUDC|nr:hypothetical protein NDAI_0E02340 [Naumovozyma dairenensis CBS 421]CCD25051.1 hypothetical protein NDAI_0E02340 [Naumovozyma dairenensis CBS 421]